MHYVLIGIIVYVVLVTFLLLFFAGKARSDRAYEEWRKRWK